MNEREVRMRAIEALSAMGVRESQRLVRDAEVLTEWVMAGEDKAEAPKRSRKPKEDKVDSPL